MGFSCFVCAVPFGESESSSENGCGDGFKDRPGRPASVIVKCGHLFHTDCLKKVLEGQSTNAWTTKSCPVCHILLNRQDIIPVHANSYDSSSNQRPRIEEIIIAHRKVQDENSSLYKRLEMIQSQIRDMNIDGETAKRQKDELTLRLEQMSRLNAINKADMERYKGEIEKLKNIIITLTEKLTGNDCVLHDYYGSATSNGMNASNLCRLEFTDELQRIPVCDTSMSQNITASSISKSSANRPPGFLYPISSAMENGLSCSEADSGSHIMSGIPDVRDTPDLGSVVSLPGNVNTRKLFQMPDENHQAQLTCFSIQDTQARDFDTNNNSSEVMHKSEEILKQSKENIPAKVVDTSGSSGCSSNMIVGKADSHGFISSIQNDMAKINESEDDYAEGDYCDSWSEKKSRRRSSSKCSTPASRSRGNRYSGKYESLADKKLLYGSFLCPTCKAKWGSSQSILNTPQTCRYCRTEVHPYNQGPILPRKQLESMIKQPTSSSSGSKVAATNNRKK